MKNLSVDLNKKVRYMPACFDCETPGAYRLALAFFIADSTEGVCYVCRRCAKSWVYMNSTWQKDSQVAEIVDLLEVRS